ncbi:hypothetical protein VP01_6899g1, partial [Puccinia sorghi]
VYLDGQEFTILTLVSVTELLDGLMEVFGKLTIGKYNFQFKSLVYPVEGVEDTCIECYVQDLNSRIICKEMSKEWIDAFTLDRKMVLASEAAVQFVGAAPSGSSSCSTQHFLPSQLTESSPIGSHILHPPSPHFTSSHISLLPLPPLPCSLNMLQMILIHILSMHLGLMRCMKIMMGPPALQSLCLSQWSINVSIAWWEVPWQILSMKDLLESMICVFFKGRIQFFVWLLIVKRGWISTLDSSPFPLQLSFGVTRLGLADSIFGFTWLDRQGWVASGSLKGGQEFRGLGSRPP